MRILHVHHRAEFIGGAEAHVSALFRAQEGRGHRVVLVAGCAPGAGNPPGVVGVERPIFDPARQFEDREFELALGHAAERLQPELVHLHHTSNLPVSIYRQLRSLGVPLVQSLYDHALLCTNGWMVRGDGSACAGGPGEQCQKFACESNQAFDASQIAAAAWRLAEARATVDACVVGTDTLGASAAALGLARPHVVPYFPLGAPPEARSRTTGVERIVVVARLEREKGVEVLLEAFAELAARRPMAELVVVGGGSRAGALSERISALGLARRVSLLGSLGREAAMAAIASASVLCVPSIWAETMPLVLLDAFSAGVPVVATRAGGIPFAVHHGASGLLVPPSDPVALARALGRVLAEPALAATLVEGGKQRLSAFDRERHLESLDQLYRELSADPAAARTSAPAAELPLREVRFLMAAMARDLAEARAKQLELVADFESERDWIRATVGYVQRDPLTRAVNRLRGGPDLERFLEDLA